MIFILGVERSATTWVANILDHHPKTEVYMEPLSQFNSRFKRWPGRFITLENIEQKVNYFIKEFGILKKHNLFLLTRLSSTPTAWQTDLKLAKFLTQKQLASDSIKDFLELNFHRKGRQITVPKKRPLQTIIKEVRLNFNAELIYKIEKKVKTLVVIRDLASCIRSILVQIGEGNLVELSKELKQQYGKISPQTVCEYWFESYSTLIDTLQNQQIPHRIVSHTSLIKNPNSTVDEMFQFLNLPVTHEVKYYLQLSNQPGRGKHNTNRNSKILLEQTQKDRKNIYPLIQQELKRIRRHRLLKQFIDK